MPSDVDVFGVYTIRTERNRKVTLDDARRTVSYERSVFKRHAVDRVNPGTGRVQVAIAFVAEVSTTARHGVEHELLHPCGAAAHLRHDKDVFRSRLVVFRALEHLRAADFRRTIDAVILECRHG